MSEEKPLFELWDMGTGNMTGSYRSISEAVWIIGEAVGHSGPDVLTDLSLLVVRGEKSDPIAETPEQWRTIFRAFEFTSSFAVIADTNRLGHFDILSGALDAIRDAAVFPRPDGSDPLSAFWLTENAGRYGISIVNDAETLRRLLDQQQRDRDEDEKQ